MPFLNARDLEFYYETAGDLASPPLLIISGLTDYTAKTNWQRDDLAEDFYTITFDNRGAGRSSVPDPGYTTADMAEDAAAILETLDIPSAYVFGFSLGGMIAQNLAINHPQKVKRLILGCTTAGGRLSVPPDESIFRAITSPVSSGDKRQDFLKGMWVSLSLNSIERRDDLVQTLADIAAANPQTSLGYAGQIQAVLSHDVAGRLSEIAIPTLVLHGELDRVISPGNGRLLAEHIPNARLILYPEAGHLFFIEQSAAVNEDIRAFLSAKD